MRDWILWNDVRFLMDKVLLLVNFLFIFEYVEICIGIFWKKLDKIKNLYIFLVWSVEVRKFIFICIFKFEKD